MFRRSLPLLSTAVLLGLAAGVRAGDDEARAILTKAIKAHGGEEKLTKYQAGQAKSKGKVNLPQLGDVDFTQELAYQLPDKLKESLDLVVNNQTIPIVTLCNGDTASVTAGGNEIPMTDDIMKALKHTQYMMKVGRLVALVKDKSYELAPLGEVMVEGKPAVGVRVSSKGHKDISLFFNKETGLLAKLEHRTSDPMTGKEIAEERIILEYSPKDRDGFALPKKLRVLHDNAKFMEAEVVEAKLLEKLDDSQFKK